MNNPPTSDEPKAPPARAWVWHCTEDSIAAGQISVLAALETLLAVGLYWWRSYRFAWHWFSALGLIAAPILLLRSEESVELGVAMLRRWHERKGSEVGRWEKTAVALVTHCLRARWLISSPRLGCQGSRAGPCSGGRG